MRRLAVTLSVAVLGLSGCRSPVGGQPSLPTDLSVIYSGPFASNMTVPDVTVGLAAGEITVNAASLFESLGFTLTARASVDESSVPNVLTVEVRSHPPFAGLATGGIIIYSVRVTTIPAGDYTLRLVRTEVGTADRIVHEQGVTIP